MIKKPNQKKLQLDKLSLRTLSTSQAALAAGGGTIVTRMTRCVCPD